jgi:predicted RNase H-like HicB family nuclease
MKTKYAYPAIFTDDETESGKHVYFVEFPDIPSCYTQGDDLEEAAIMAKDVLEGRVELALERGESLPAPSDVDTLTGGKVMLVVADITNMKSQSRYTKTTLSLPTWLYNEAKKSNINMSGVFQDAIQERLHLTS